MQKPKKGGIMLIINGTKQAISALLGAVIAAMALRFVAVLITLYASHDYFQRIHYSGLAWWLAIFLSVAFVSWINSYENKKQTRQLGILVRCLVCICILLTLATGVYSIFQSLP